MLIAAKQNKPSQNRVGNYFGIHYWTLITWHLWVSCRRGAIQAKLSAPGVCAQFCTRSVFPLKFICHTKTVAKFRIAILCGAFLRYSTLRCVTYLNVDHFLFELYVIHQFCFFSLWGIGQVHGVVYDTIRFVGGILRQEMNSATDNPMVLAEQNVVVSGSCFFFVPFAVTFFVLDFTLMHTCVL